MADGVTSVGAAMKRGTGLSRAIGESRGRAPEGERVSQKGRAPRTRPAATLGLRGAASEYAPFGAPPPLICLEALVGAVPHSSGAKMRRENASVFSPLPACGERSDCKRQRSNPGEGAFPRFRTCTDELRHFRLLRGPPPSGEAPSSRPSPRKRGEGAVRAARCSLRRRNAIMLQRTYPGRLTRGQWLSLSDGERYLLAARADADSLESRRSCSKKYVPARPCLPWRRALQGKALPSRLQKSEFPPAWLRV